MKKHDVITVKITCHIPVHRNDSDSVDGAYEAVRHLRITAEGLGETIWEMDDAELPDNLEIPDNLRRTAAAE